MPKPINAQLLKKLEACFPQVELFEKIFGEEDAPLSVETAVKRASDFDWDWAAMNLLSEENRETYEEAKAHLLKTYKEAKAHLLKTYEKAKAPLRKTYEEAKAPLLKTYKEAKAPLRKTYEEAKAPLLKTYKEAKAQTFAELYLTQQ
jgi:hypothetical protein